MITIKKLKSLKDGTRLRKYVAILKDFEESISCSHFFDQNYAREILNLILEEELPELSRTQFQQTEISLRNINSIRHILMKHLSIEPSEWDLYTPRDNYINRQFFPIKIYAEDIRSPFNLGSIFRTSECFGVEKIYISENSTDPNHKRCQRTSMGCTNIIPWETLSLNSIKGPVFALELGGIDIKDFKFPKDGTLIIGSEELGVSPEALNICKSSLGVVTIPLIGGKSSLNVASATSILLQRWCESLLKS